MEHFDRKEAEHNILSNINFNQDDNETLQEVPNRIMQVPAKNTPEEIQQIEQQPPLREDENKQRFQSQLQLQFQPIIHMPSAPSQTEIADSLQYQQPQYRMPVLESDYEFVRKFKLNII